MGLIRYYGALPMADTALFTTAGADVTLGGLVALNATGSPATLSLSVRRASGQVETLCNALPVAANSGQEVVRDAWQALSGVLLRAGGDSLHGSASAAGTITFLAYE